MKSILLVGGAGYVGTVLTSHLLKMGYRVNVVDNFIYQNQFAIQPFLGDKEYKLYYGNMDDRLILDEASKGVTDVVILAGLVGDPVTKKYPAISDSINNTGVKNCIDYFDDKKIDKLIFISTCSNYGLIKENELADEEFHLSPLSLYAKAKVSNEQYVLNKKDTVDYTAVVLRFATAFGLSPRMRFDLSVSEFTRDISFDEELIVYDEDTWRPYCHLRDFARLIEMVILADSNKVSFEVFNAGGDVNNFTKRMIIDTILKFIPGGKVRYGANGSDPRNYKVSFAKIKRVLGFEPQFTVQDGIEELIEAFKIGVYADSIRNREKYGNYSLKSLEAMPVSALSH
jgi:nucleoside-diphosphate-sugar epimerase